MRCASAIGSKSPSVRKRRSWIATRSPISWGLSGGGAHHPDGDRRRFRRQARSLGAAARGARRLDAAEAGALHLFAARIDDGDDQAPSLANPRARRRRPSGRLLAVDFAIDFDTGAYASWGPTVANRVPVHATGPYLVPHVRAMSRALHTNNPPSGAFRGFGVPQAAIAHEGLMDQLADKLGMDRLEFRLLNAIRAGEATATGQVLTSSAGLAACLEALRHDWREALARRVTEGPVRRGVGIACMWYGIGNTSLPNPSTMRIGLKPMAA